MSYKSVAIERSKGRLSESLWDQLAEVATAHGCELLHIQFQGKIMRLFLDRPTPEGTPASMADGATLEHVTIEHCAAVSREASVLLDTLSHTESSYVLEVSSPGLDREFYDASDYLRFTGRPVKVTFRDEADKKTTIRGRLEAADPEAGSATVLEQDSQQLMHIPIDRIQKARLELEI